MEKTFNEYVYDSDAPPPAPPKPPRKRGKKNVTIVESCAADLPQDLVDPPQDFPDPPHEFPDIL